MRARTKEERERDREKEREIKTEFAATLSASGVSRENVNAFLRARRIASRARLIKRQGIFFSLSLSFSRCNGDEARLPALSLSRGSLTPGIQLLDLAFCDTSRFRDVRALALGGEHDETWADTTSS